MKLIKVIILLILLFIPNSIEAAEQDLSTTDGSKATGNCNGTKSCWSVAYTSVRISVVDNKGNVVLNKDGNRMIMDFSSKQYHYNLLKSQKMYTYNYKNSNNIYSKTEFLNGSASFDKAYWGLSNIKTEYVVDFPDWYHDATKFGKNWLETNKYAKDLLKKMLTKMGYTCFVGNSNKFGVSSTCSLDFLKNHYILIEPVSAIEIYNIGTFYGSQLELANIYERYSSLMGNTNTVVRRYMSFNFYLDGNLKYTDPDTGQTVDKYNNGYFNGLLLSREDYLKAHPTSYCTSNKDIKVDCGSKGGNATGLIYPYKNSLSGSCNLSDPTLFTYDTVSKKQSVCCEEIANNPSKYKYNSAKEFYEDTLTSLNKTYKELCSTPDDDEKYKGCDYSLIVDDDEDCTKNISGSYKDTKDWECIYYSSKIKNNSINKYYYKTSENATQVHSESGKTYCEIYCREEITYDFPQVFDVIAGGYVTVNSNSGFEVIQPIKITGTSECKTKSINYSSFLEDYNKYNNNMKKYWDLWHINQVKQNIVNSASKSSTKDCDEKCNDKGENCRYRGYTMTTKDGSYTYTDGNKETIVVGSYCSTDKPSYQNEIDSNKTSYNSSKKNRDEAIARIYKCNNFQRIYSEFNPELTLNMPDLKVYDKTYNLQYNDVTNTKSYYYNSSNAINNTKTWIEDEITGTKNSNSKNDFTNNSSIIVGESKVLDNYYDCITGDTGLNLSGCSIKYNQKYPSNNTVTEITTIDRFYKLESNLYRFITKEGISYSSSIKKSVNDIDLEFSNIPIAYSTLTGKKNFNLAYDKVLFGNNQNFKNYVLGTDNYYNSTDNKAYKRNGQYTCNYIVTSEFQEIPGNNGEEPIDVTVIYRPISLLHPFPNYNAKGRDSGFNWKNFENYILNNRNVEGDKVYELKPMYEFYITASNIINIRKYNDSKDDEGNYADFNLTCVDGKYCTSEFIRKGKNKNYFSYTTNNGGVCITSDKTTWESCRVK